MSRAIPLAILICLMLLQPLPAGAENPRLTHTPPKWQELSRGLMFAEVSVLKGEEVVAGLAVVKADPAHNRFQVFHDAPKTIVQWQEETQAPVLFNAAYYSPQGQPVGLILTDGRPLGPWRNPQMRGMFVAEPKGMSPDLPRATILDLVNSRVDVKNLPWTQGVQSFPLLLDYRGRIRVLESGKKAHRTVIAADRNGNILVFNTRDDFFTLHELALFLKASAFDIDSALNLDGGTEAQLYIKTQDQEYLSPATWTTRLGSLLDRREFWLPTVIGIFPR